MVKDYLSNLTYPYSVSPSHSARSALQLSNSASGIFGRLLRQLGAMLAEYWHRQAQGEAIRRDSEHLYTLTDAQLRDIGITRMDIPRAVRFGKHEL